VVDVCLDKTMLLLGGRVLGGVACMRLYRVVIVVSPLCEMIGKLIARNIGSGIFKVDHNQLLVFISRLQ
jgi:hypothetical protein